MQQHLGATNEATLRRIRCGDGRVLEVLTEGSGRQVPLVFHDGSPSAAVAYPPLHRAAARCGLSVVTWSRPGYAGSTPQTGRSVAEVAADTAAVLDALDADGFVTLGWSGGGPYALACAALLPERCRAAVSLAGLAPYGVDGLDWLAGMGAENVAGFSAAIAGEEPLTALLDAVAPVMSRGQANDIAQLLGDIVSEVDKVALTGEFAEFMAAVIRRALSHGVAGWRDDALAAVHDWGFDLGTIATPTLIWHGGQDRMVPFEHGRWLSEHIPGAVARLHPDQGHLSLVVTHMADIIEELATFAVI